jgi:hypothetical protein
MGEFGDDLIRALGIEKAQPHIVEDVQVSTVEGFDDDDVRFRIGLRTKDGTLEWFVSENILFLGDDEDETNIDRVGHYLETLQEDRIRKRMKSCGAFDDE